MSEPRSREFSELPLTVDRGVDTPLPTQIAVALREAIDHDTLRPGEPVPATRELARRLGVARGVVVSAYAQLIEEGYLTAGHGRGTRVHPDLRAIDRGVIDGAPKRSDSQPARAPLRTPGPLAPGLPDTSAVNTAAWRAAWRAASAQTHLEAPELGEPQLRSEIAEHLRRVRGTTRPPEDVIVTAGTREGLGFLLSSLGTTHGRAITLGVEEPGYPSLRRVAARHSAHIVALPVDSEGLVTDDLPVGLLDAILVTPSHQYPLGGSLPLGRRRQLLEWAHRTGSIIIEDDYDSELRHSGSPLPTLAALDDRTTGCVALLGTFSKTVSQALSAGFLVIPESLRQIVEPARRDLGGPVSALVQAALAEYLSSGELRRHNARMRKHYALRRELVVEVLYGVPGVRVRPMSGGLHAVIEFTGATRETEDRVVSHCAELGTVPLSSYWHGREESASLFGLIIGTGGNLSLDEFRRALQELRRRLESVLHGNRPPMRRPV